jgi:hypothetical protein
MQVNQGGPGAASTCGEHIDAAIQRPLVGDPSAPLIMGVSIARQGEDWTVIRFRRGLDGRSVPAVKYYIPKPIPIASRIMEQVNLHKPDAVFIDGTGIGWGVYDRLGQLGCPHGIGTVHVIELFDGPSAAVPASRNTWR